jgi:hypothetical protein
MGKSIVSTIVLSALLGLFIDTGFAQTYDSDPAATPGTGETEEIEEIEEIDEIEVVGPIPGWDSEAYARIERAVNVMTASTIRKHSFLFTIDHRTWQALEEDSFQDFLGFDAGNLKIGLGLRYGILDNLEVGVLRSNGTFPRHRSDTYDFDGKYQLFHQDRQYIDGAVRGGITWLSTEDDEDSAGFFFQFLATRVISERLRLGTGFLYHSDSYNDDKLEIDDDYSVAIPLLVEVRLTRRMALSGELVPNVAGYREDHPVFAISIKFITHRHSFAIVFSNNQHFTPDGIVTNTNRDFDDMIMGFTITRELHI